MANNVKVKNKLKELKEFQKKYGGEIINDKLVFKGYANFSGCTSLEEIPEGTVFNDYANFSGCTLLKEIPEGTVFNGSADFSGCALLKKIPKGTIFKGYAYFNGCTSLKEIPKGTIFNSSAYFNGCTSLRPIPDHLGKIKNLYIFPNLNWNDIKWINRILNDELTAEEVFAIDNVEHRRVAYEHMNKMKMKDLKDYKVLDESIDEKELPMKIVSFTVQNMKEPLIFYNCHCPSTKREYFLQTKETTCKKAKSMMWGLDEVEFVNAW